MRRAGVPHDWLQQKRALIPQEVNGDSMGPRGGQELSDGAPDANDHDRETEDQ